MAGAVARLRPLFCQQTCMEDELFDPTRYSQEHLYEHKSPKNTYTNTRVPRTPIRTLPSHRDDAHIRFCHPAFAGFPAGFKFLLATLRHYVWVARNSWQFEGTQPDPQVLVEKIESTFRFVSKVQQRVL